MPPAAPRSPPPQSAEKLRGAHRSARSPATLREANEGGGDDDEDVDESADEGPVVDGGDADEDVDESADTDDDADEGIDESGDGGPSAQGLAHRGQH